MIQLEGNLVFQSGSRVIRLSAVGNGIQLFVPDWNTLKGMLKTSSFFMPLSLKATSYLTNLKQPIEVLIGDDRKFVLDRGKVRGYSFSTIWRLATIYLSVKFS
ncbi:MAG: hypothetical protein AAF789_04725 [Bacteroidota bacterium]